MKILADFHIHIYPFYSIENLFISLLKNFKRISNLHSTPEIYAVFLAERYDCNFFNDVVLKKEKFKSDQFQINATFNNDAIKIQYSDGNLIYLFPGRQIVTKKRLEILSLCSKSKIPDGLSALETINSITEVSGIPVLSWAPGKWFFQRGKIVNELLNTIKPENLFIGDTSLRPTIWTKPFLMRKAENLNFKILSGSDPLPFKGEENLAGSYASFLEGDFQKNEPNDSIKKILLEKNLNIKHLGKRSSLNQTLYRLYKNKKAKA